MRGVLGGLLDSFHFLLAAGVVEWTDDDGLSEEDVACGGEFGLEGDRLVKITLNRMRLSGRSEAGS